MESMYKFLLISQTWFAMPPREDSTKSGVTEEPPALVWPMEEGLGVLMSEILRGIQTNQKGS